MDPFLGSGSTIIAANQLGLNGIGFEVNPFSYFFQNVNYVITVPRLLWSLKMHHKKY